MHCYCQLLSVDSVHSLIRTTPLPHRVDHLLTTSTASFRCSEVTADYADVRGGGHMDGQLTTSEWGRVPEPIRGVLQRPKERAADAMETDKINEDAPRNHDEAFLKLSWDSFHQPKPPQPAPRRSASASAHSAPRNGAESPMLWSPWPRRWLIRGSSRGSPQPIRHGRHPGFPARVARAVSLLRSFKADLRPATPGITCKPAGNAKDRE